jgi:hypothetical protein
MSTVTASLKYYIEQEGSVKGDDVRDMRTHAESH